MVNGREYSEGFFMFTQGYFGKCVEPCLRSTESSVDFVVLQSIDTLSIVSKQTTIENCAGHTLFELDNEVHPKIYL